MFARIARDSFDKRPLGVEWRIVFVDVSSLRNPAMQANDLHRKTINRGRGAGENFRHRPLDIYGLV
jgi:hypothetical protein